MIALLTGAAVMALELLAGRWLAPWFGMTLTTWSWVIALTLGAGALGAWLAMRGPSRGVTSPLLLAALFVTGDAMGPRHVLHSAFWNSDTSMPTVVNVAAPMKDE